MNTINKHAVTSYREIIQQSKSSRAKLGPDMEVARVIPSQHVEAVGPFVFFDHVGPIPSPDQTIAPHPHAGIEVITYLMEGTNTHEDSMGNVGRVTSGGLQWITAGSGMLHKERIVPDTDQFHALQLWTRMPKSLENELPCYRTVRSDEIPEKSGPQAIVRLLAGRLPEMFDKAGPLKLAQPTFLVHLKLQSANTFEMDLDGDGEFGLYVMNGSVEVAGDRIEPRSFAILGRGSKLKLVPVGKEAVDVLILGGERAARPIVIYGSFVYDSEEAGEQATRAYYMGRMGTIDGVPF